MTFDAGNWERWFTDRGEQERERPSGQRRTAKATWIIAAIIALFIVANMAKGVYTEWLWFGNLGYDSVYATILKARLVIFFVAAILFAILFLSNMMLAMRLASRSETSMLPPALVSLASRLAKKSVILATVILSLIFGYVAQRAWEMVLRFSNGQLFGIVDPVFQRDVAFYMFSMPFQSLLRGWFLGALFVILIGTLAVYWLGYGVRGKRFYNFRPGLAHMAGLAAGILGLFAWGYWLGVWGLVWSEQGVVYGASYTDMHARLPAQWILLSIVLIVIGIIFVAAWRRKLRLALYGIGVWLAVSIIVGTMFPAAVQRFQVQPNELTMEKPYIEYNIEFTREAFALDRIEERDFPADGEPSSEDIAENAATINNIRLWDHRPLKDTYNQIQSIRLYYDFLDVDVDRYVIDGEYRQVMLSARELSAEKLAEEAQTWINRRLQFTHGYGMVLSPVNEITSEGLPVLLVKDLPPTGTINVERPQIYYGEKTEDYVVVGTETQEFDYPMGNQNIYGHYEGEGGISIGSFMRRFVYAWQLGDFNILISSEVGSESKVLYHRDIAERVRQMAPFLALDPDPYLVVVEGRLFWIQDAYTVSDSYPYSQPLSDGTNYIRNSVKVVIDAYDGNVTLYVTESEDPLIRTYEAIFPTLFRPLEEMPTELRAHLRYPEGMFNVQAEVYQTYHMRDARVFYNKEDLWTRPWEIYSSMEQIMEPYYVILRLPDEEKEEFLLMLPFTPVNKNNTIGWLAARNDGDNYGKLLAYSFPKEKLVYGPSQLENRIQQDTVITEQFALWSRGGSSVIRGNLLMIPIGTSIFYVEPVFLQADSGGLPELKRVIVAAGDDIAMKPTLAQSLAAVFGNEEPPVGPDESEESEKLVESEVPVTAGLATLVTKAEGHYLKAQEYLKAGDWVGYGQELDALAKALADLSQLTSGDGR